VCVYVCVCAYLSVSAHCRVTFQICISKVKQILNSHIEDNVRPQKPPVNCGSLTKSPDEHLNLFTCFEGCYYCR